MLELVQILFIILDDPHIFTRIESYFPWIEAKLSNTADDSEVEGSNFWNYIRKRSIIIWILGVTLALVFGTLVAIFATQKRSKSLPAIPKPTPASATAPADNCLSGPITAYLPVVSTTSHSSLSYFQPASAGAGTIHIPPPIPSTAQPQPIPSNVFKC